MKAKKLLLIAVLTALLAGSLYAQEPSNSKNVDDLNDMGLYIGLDVNYAGIDSEPAGDLGLKAVLALNSKWGIGLAGTGIWYDYRLDELSEVGTYHLEAAYSGLIVEYNLALSPKSKVSFTLLSGMGVAQYRYDHEYQKDLVWTEEIIDRTSFAVFEPGFELMTRLSNKWWLGAGLAYRTTSPLRLIDTPEDMLQNFKGGIRVRYTLF